MPTTIEQHMHQDEWLASLRTAESQGYGTEALHAEPRCVVGRAIAIMEEDEDLARARERDVNTVAAMFGISATSIFCSPYRRVITHQDAAQWLGISVVMTRALWEMNDGFGTLMEVVDKGYAIEYHYERTGARSLPDIADWFKVQRDAYDGDLTAWNGER